MIKEKALKTLQEETNNLFYLDSKDLKEWGLEPFNILLYKLIKDREDFKLTFLINIKLNVLMAKNDNEISIKSSNGTGKFSRFSYDDLNQDITWELIKNQTNFNSNQNNSGFFSENNITMNLIPETLDCSNLPISLLKELKKSKKPTFYNLRQF